MRYVTGAAFIALMALPAIASAAEPRQRAAPADPDQQVRCRSSEVTGSLARRTRICRTVAEWRRLEIRGNDEARDMQRRGLIAPGIKPGE